MSLQLKDLTINTSELDTSKLMEYWSWLTGGMKEVLFISRMGDLFYQKQDGHIYWLATDYGKIFKVAESAHQFNELLQDECNLDNWFLPSLISELTQAGKHLTNSQVYSFNLLPLMGGEYDIANIEPTDVSVHFALTGQICEQIKGLPDGTRVKLTITH